MRIFLFLLFLLASLHALCQSMPEASKGVLDARQWNFHEKKIALNGYWKFYSNDFVSPADSSQSISSNSFFPEVWAPSVQYGTYQLLVILPTDTARMAIELPQIYCSYELWVDGKKIGENGKIGTTRDSSTPQWLPQSIVFEHQNDSVSITLFISNFYHFKGGSKEPLYLGTADMIHTHHTVSIQSSFVEAIGLIVLGVGFLLIYYLREERKKITFYFSLLCLSWAIRSEFSNMYVFISYFPDFDWTTMIRIEYITLFITMIWAILFVSRLFISESFKIIKYILVVINCVFVVIAALTSPVLFTRWLDMYLGVAGVLIVVCAIIVIRAWINERSGVRYVVACIVLSVLLFSYDIIVYEGFLHYYNSLFFSIGYLLIFALMGVSLLYHLQIFKGDGSSSVLTYEDLYGKKSN